MKTMSFYSIKGGVGKTTSAVNIAHLAAMDSFHTILWDLDPQACASWYLKSDGVNPHKALSTFKGKNPLGELRVKTQYPNLEVIPADLSLRKLEQLLAEDNYSKQLLGELAEGLGERNKLLIFDCAPSLSSVTESLLNCSDIIAVPMVPSPLSLRAYSQLTEFVHGKKKWKHIEFMPFFTMVDRRRKAHREVIENAKHYIGEKNPILIPNSSKVEGMGLTKKPITDFAANTTAAKEYKKLWKELKTRFKLK